MIFTALAKAFFIVFLYLLYWALGFVGVRWWMRRSESWHGNPLASRTALIAGALAGPLCWILGLIIHGWDSPSGPKGGQP